jgi:hypothetical protein
VLITLAQHGIHNRNDVGQRLARTGTSRQNVAFASSRNLERLALVPMKNDRIATRILQVALVAKDSIGLGMEELECNQLVD